jgi:hypothetical protein
MLMMGNNKLGGLIVLFTAAEYKSMREEYCYYDRECRFEILPTGKGVHEFRNSQRLEEIFPFFVDCSISLH